VREIAIVRGSYQAPKLMRSCLASNLTSSFEAQKTTPVAATVTKVDVGQSACFLFMFGFHAVDIFVAPLSAMI